MPQCYLQGVLKAERLSSAKMELPVGDWLGLSGCLGRESVLHCNCSGFFSARLAISVNAQSSISGFCLLHHVRKLQPGDIATEKHLVQGDELAKAIVVDAGLEGL